MTNRFKLQPSSIVYKLTRFTLGIIVLQTFLFGAILIKGGVIEDAKSNAYQLFQEKTSSRRDYVLREMKNKWTNIGPYVKNISKLLNSQQQEFDKNVFFESAISELITMLRATQVTGAYIILEGVSCDTENQPAMYLRDYDPIMNSYGSDDIYMVYGPSNLAKSLKIPLDSSWRCFFEETEENNEFIHKPYDEAKASLTDKATLLGYWSKPFKLQPDDIPIVTYSMPLFDSSGALRGVVGIEITLSYLEKYFPAAELQPQDSLGYLIAYSDDNGENMTPIIMGGSLQRRMIDENQPLSLKAVDSNKGIYTIENHKGKEKLFASVEKIGMYQNNTPFEDEMWYLMGIMREDYLLSYANRIQQVLWLTLFVALLFGGGCAILISVQMSKPIVKLAHEVNDSSKLITFKMNPTGLVELDELSHAIELANKRTHESASRLTKIVELFELPIGAYEINHEAKTVFVTQNFSSIIGWETANMDKINAEEFNTMLQETLSSPFTKENNVYEIGSEGKKWIRFKQTEQENATIGVVLDVTDDILEKKQLMRERDHDPLTMLLNRKGFQWSYEAWLKGCRHEKKAALVMFDLDNLKSINDTYGHKWGDQYILTAVEHMKMIALESNTILGRRSGDEFVMLLHGFESKDDIRNCMEGFYNGLELERMELPDGNSIHVMMSAGLMWIEGENFTYDELLNFADEALYEAKRSRKGFYVENNQV